MARCGARDGACDVRAICVAMWCSAHSWGVAEERFDLVQLQEWCEVVHCAGLGFLVKI